MQDKYFSWNILKQEIPKGPTIFFIEISRQIYLRTVKQQLESQYTACSFLFPPSYLQMYKCNLERINKSGKYVFKENVL